MISIARQRGFTLLELLVVLTLLGLAAGVVAPRASRWLDAAAERGWKADLKAQIEGLPIRAFLAGTPLVVDAQQLQAALPGRPAGLQIQMKRALRYGATGAAGGGAVEIQTRDAREIWTVRPVTGEVLVSP